MDKKQRRQQRTQAIERLAQQWKAGKYKYFSLSRLRSRAKQYLLFHGVTE